MTHRPPPETRSRLAALFVSGGERRGREADRVLAEVLDWFAEPAPDFVRRRHRELAARGLTNDRIFAAIAIELPERLFPAPPLSSRQLRRLVYG